MHVALIIYHVFWWSVSFGFAIFCWSEKLEHWREKAVAIFSIALVLVSGFFVFAG